MTNDEIRNFFEGHTLQDVDFKQHETKKRNNKTDMIEDMCHGLFRH